MIKITGDYYFEKDNKVNNYSLYRHECREKTTRFGKEGTGEMIEVNALVGYYANIEQMCKAAAEDYVSRKSNVGEVTNIHEWLKEYKNAVKMLTDAINGAVE